MAEGAQIGITGKIATKSKVSKKENTVCVADTVNKRGAGRRHDYLYTPSPVDAYSVSLFRVAIISSL